jgi:hypothetical protein
VRLWHLGWEGRGDAGGEPGLPLPNAAAAAAAPRPVHSREMVAGAYPRSP